MQQRCLLSAELSQNLPSELTFTRAAGNNSYQTGPAVDGTTFIAMNAGVNVPRFHYVPALGRRALLIEGTRKNYVHDSNFVCVANLPGGWGINAGVAGVDFGCAAGGPHGGHYFRILDTAVANVGVVDVACDAIGAATQFASSLLSYRPVGGAASAWYSWNTNPGAAAIPIPDAAHDWTACSVVASTVGASTTAYLCMVGDPSGAFRSACSQTEVGAFASTWIPTAGAAATRAAELALISAACINPTEGRLHFPFCPGYASTVTFGTPWLFRFNANTYIGITAAGAVQVFDGGVGRATSGALTWNPWDLLDVDLVYGPAGTRLEVNGTTYTDANAWAGAALNAPALGAQAAGTNEANGAFGGLSIWG